MSGGHYDYKYEILSSLAEEIEDDCVSGEIPSDIKEFMLSVAKQLDSLSEKAREIEWYMSGDHGEDSMRKFISSFK
jgi:hypothetical protein